MSRPTNAPGSLVHSVAEGAQLVPSVERAVRILMTLAGETNASTLASLSQGLGLPRSSTLALCNTRQRAGLVTRDGTKLYRLGPSTLLERRLRPERLHPGRDAAVDGNLEQHLLDLLPRAAVANRNANVDA